MLYGVTGALIGMAGKIVLPSLSNTDGAFAAIAQAVLPVGVSGLVAAAALAALMSTASACLLASSTIALEDVLPAIRRKPSGGLAAGRVTTLFMGAVMLGLAFVVRDVLAALTLAYNLLVGGMLIPLVGRSSGARHQRRRHCQHADRQPVRGGADGGGIDANSPIYGGLLGGGVAFVLGSLLSRPAAQLQPQTER